MAMPSGAYLPVRIRSAIIKEGVFQITTSKGEESLPFSSIELFSLGVIEEKAGSAEVEPSGMRSMLRKVLLGATPDDPHKKVKEARVKRTYYLDFFVKNSKFPYRIESTSMNYKSLSLAAPVPVEWEQEQWHTAELCTKKGSSIPEVKVDREVTSDFKYPTSLDNFKNLVNFILEKASHAFMNDACRIFKETKRIDEKIYATVYEFQMESLELFKKIVPVSSEDTSSNG